MRDVTDFLMTTGIDPHALGVRAIADQSPLEARLSETFQALVEYHGEHDWSDSDYKTAGMVLGLAVNDLASSGGK